MAFINSIGLANAPFKHAQKDILNFMLEMYEVPEADINKVKRLYERSEIETRYAAIADFSVSKSQWTFFEQDSITPVEKRMKKFFEIAPGLCIEAILNCVSRDQLTEITHLITVSCTGISAPGLDIQLMQLLKLDSAIHRSSINFMGCYAAIHALKQANSICQADLKAKVLIVDIELCTLHFQDSYSMDNIAASLLFADGAAAMIVSNEKGIFEIDDFYSEVALEGYHDMAWEVSSTGFQMILSAYIPMIISANIETMLKNSLLKMKITKDEIKHWAIHPGGKKIVNEIAKVLSLSESDIAMSRSVLNDYGNMSSVTLIYLLERMKRNIVCENEAVYAVAFGPGLTIESMFLKSC